MTDADQPRFYSPGMYVRERLGEAGHRYITTEGKPVGGERVAAALNTPQAIAVIDGEPVPELWPTATLGEMRECPNEWEVQRADGSGWQPVNLAAMQHLADGYRAVARHKPATRKVPAIDQWCNENPLPVDPDKRVKTTLHRGAVSGSDPTLLAVELAGCTEPGWYAPNDEVEVAADA